MHAYCIVSTDDNQIQAELDKIITSLGKPMIYPFSVTKIDDARRLVKESSLTVATPMAFFLPHFEDASEEAQNAILKSLEEPQPNLYYILSISKTSAILPTILSRCKVVLAKHASSTDTQAGDVFLRQTTGERLKSLSTISKREDALVLIKSILSASLAQRDKTTLEMAHQTFAALKKNGNVAAQLTALVVALDMPRYKTL